jgi:hypothetical protein
MGSQVPQAPSPFLPATPPPLVPLGSGGQRNLPAAVPGDSNDGDDANTANPPGATRTSTAPTAPTAILTVSRQGSIGGGDGADFQSIADAIRAAPAGARIVLRRGIYEEDLHVFKPVEIVAEENTPREQVIVATQGYAALWVKSQGVKVRGITFISRRLTHAELEAEKGKHLDCNEDADDLEDEDDAADPAAGEEYYEDGAADQFEGAVCISMEEWRYGREQRGAVWFGAVGFVDDGCSAHIEDCALICHGERVGPLTYDDLDITVLHIGMNATVRVGGCLIQGGEVGVRPHPVRSAAESDWVILDDCQIMGFRATGVQGNQWIRIARCRVQGADLPYRLEVGNGIALGSTRSDEKRPSGPEQVVAIVEDCEIHGCGGWGVGMSHIYQMSSAAASWQSDHTQKVVLRGCHITGHSEGGVSSEGGVLEMENCVITDNGTKAPKHDVLDSVGVEKRGGRLVLKGCRINRNGFAVKVPQEKWRSLGADGAVVQIEAENCDLLGNDLGSWSVPDSTTVVSLMCRENVNKALQVARFLKFAKH